MVIGILALAGTVESSKTYTYKLTSTEIQKPRPIRYIYSTEYLKDYVGEMSIKYGLSTQQYQNMMATITCESNWNVLADNGISYGIAQFTPATWKDFGHGDIMNPISQLEVMTSMFKRGLAERWDCYRTIKNLTAK